jgi:ketosteroid isomerase-like protein
VSEEAVLRAIERLHQKDMAASRTGDFETLRSIMTDDVAIHPTGW